MKRIVFCADGTWDTVSSHTNVYKLFNALTTTPTQIPAYDDGVGADGNPISRLLGGAFGAGLFQKIKEGYSTIAHLYDPGDQIFLFGFSRGAYTVRSLAGMIAICGLPTKNFTDDAVDTAFNAYRNSGNDRQALLDQLQAQCAMDDAKITMIGVWDTVGSLGIPAAIGLDDPILYGFLNTNLHPDVKNAYQALAIDEKRAQFQPTLWTPPFTADQTVEQVWYAGVHSDIGGGEPDDLPGTPALSDLALAWILGKAAKLGLAVDPAVQGQYNLPLDPAYSLDKLHSSWTIINGLPKKRSIAANAILANSVGFRCQNDDSYRPSNLTFDNGALAASYGSEAVVGTGQAGAATGGS